MIYEMADVTAAAAAGCCWLLLAAAGYCASIVFALAAELMPIMAVAMRLIALARWLAG